ncbi:hypothetical protein [Arthrobacter sp. UYCu712]|uniref:hypothetical protein n=1 Tax=Arthrobacter sp. UYCu712 TaxID=3156340 RepID=UPI003390DDE2
MRTAEPKARTDKVHHLSENLMTQLAKGREWATPGVEAALRRAVTGLDTGVESASPRIQTGLRRLADELAGGVETLTPRVHEGLRRVAQKDAPVITDPGLAETGRRAPRKAWLLVGVLALAVAGGVAAWRSFQTAHEEPVPPELLGRNSGNPDADPATATPGNSL